jgi:DNA-binding SARP family transcriptional activator
MTVRVRLLGRPEIERSDGPARPPPRGRKAWALLARVALSERALARGDVASELFASANDPLAALRWTLAELRRGLGIPDILRGDRLAVSSSDLWLDVWALEDGTLANRDLGAVLLDGVDLRDCPGFDMWLSIARSRVTARSLGELRDRALRELVGGATASASALAETAVSLDRLDDSAQELLLRCLVADGRPRLAEAHLAVCEAAFAEAGLAVSPALRAAAQDRVTQPPIGLRAGVVAESLLHAGSAALDAGAIDGGIETLRRAAADAGRAGNLALEADVLRALGSALVHAVRGCDGEGAVVLHRALLAARAAERPSVAADILRELAFIDVQAGRHVSASRAVAEAKRQAEYADDPQLQAAVLAVEGMNEADRGRHEAAVTLLARSAVLAQAAGRPRQHAWSMGVQARSLLLNGRTDDARRAAELSVAGAQAQRWNAYLPWPQAIHAECLAMDGRWDEALAEAEYAFALGCELADPCWEGMAGRALSLMASHRGDDDAAWELIVDARRRCDRVPDRYVWVSCHVGLAQLEVAERREPALVPALAARLLRDATRADLPEFTAWALLHQCRGRRPGRAVPGSHRCSRRRQPGLAYAHSCLRDLTTSAEELKCRGNGEE